MSEPRPAGNPPRTGGIEADELRLAARNHALPLEALRYPLTPTGLHYVLVHYDVPDVDAAAWQLSVTGCVDRPFELSLAELQTRPSRTLAVTLECAGNGRAFLSPRPVSQPWLSEAVGTAEWTGFPVADLLHEATLQEQGVDVVFAGLDRGLEGGVWQRYERALSADEAGAGDALLAYEMNGEPLPPQHGYPVRLIVPGWYGMTQVKWLSEIRVIDEPFEGYQQARAYNMRFTPDEKGVPVTRIEPRALLVPPGVPDFMTRTRYLRPGPVTLNGRAWSGWAPVTRVEISTDGGESWRDAAVEDGASRYAWSAFSASWDAVSGEHELCARATDADERTQPLEPTWNVHGYANNAVQRIPVVVSADADPLAP
jgi:DMSO/TMAO reductase YedYZ molybdopterin-dependent catalytic subunit